MNSHLTTEGSLSDHLDSNSMVSSNPKELCDYRQTSNAKLFDRYHELSSTIMEVFHPICLECLMPGYRSFLCAAGDVRITNAHRCSVVQLPAL